MKKLLGVLVVGSFLLIPASNVKAETKSFTVSASVPLATGVSISANKIVASTGVATPVAGTALGFSPLTFLPASNIWLPAHYFSIDVSASGGAGSTDVTAVYTEGANPNSATTGHGLGWKSTATFMKVVGSTETPLAAHGPKKMLKDLTAEHILPTEIQGGLLRVYLGIVSKDPAAVIPDPAASEVFTNADRPGTYDGTLVITATAS